MKAETRKSFKETPFCIVFRLPACTSALSFVMDGRIPSSVEELETGWRRNIETIRKTLKAEAIYVEQVGFDAPQWDFLDNYCYWCGSETGHGDLETITVESQLWTRDELWK